MDYKKIIGKLDDLVKVQCSSGNWNYDPYMQGMANGLILAQSLFKGNEPKFLEAPEEWLKDIPYTGKLTTEQGNN